MKIDRNIHTVVIGAGVVGLAVARHFALQGDEVVVFEAADVVGAQTSARGSHVIHSGIYYTPGSIKERVCVEGRKLLYEYCQEKNIPFKKLGKIIIATTDEEVETLKTLKSRAEKNGVMDVQWLTADEVKDKEPAVQCVRALFSPSTGIIDGPAFIRALCDDLKTLGVPIEISAPVTKGEVVSEGCILTIQDKNILCHRVINAAGLTAPDVARSVAGIRLESVPKAYFAKGHYFKLKGPSPFTHLIYPVPVPGGLGIHATLSMKGEVRFGPDVSWAESIDYSFDTEKETDFYTAIRKYYPALADGSLEPSHTGIRPKIVPPGSPDHDFVIQGEDEHGVSGLINLFGIESPGFTSALAIAKELGKK